MNEADRALSNIYSSDLINEKKVLSLEAYEEKVLKKLLTLTNLSSSKLDLIKRAKDATGKAKLTFAWFYTEFPTFPVRLYPRKIPRVYQITLPKLFNSFTALPMFEEWEKVKDEAPEDVPFGIIFDWPGVKSSQLVIHNYYHSSDENIVRIQRHIGTGSKKQLITIELFEALVKSIANIWGN